MLETVQLRDSRSYLFEFELLEAELCRRSLHKFIQRTWSIVEPTKPFVDNWHIVALCAVLEEVTQGNIDRLLVNIPPGCMKSLILNVFWPAWEWASDPSLRHFSGAYSDELTIRDNQSLRKIVQDPWYQRHFNVELLDDQNAKVKFSTTKGGWSIASSVGGGGIGQHPDRIKVDDPLKPQEAGSEVYRTRAVKWIEETLIMRGASRNARIVIIMQRLHEDDPCGVLSRKGGWTHIYFPMRYIPECRINGRDYKPHPMDPRKERGELLWPSLFHEELTRKLEIGLGEYGKSGQMQQLPAPQEGGLFKRHWFKILTSVPNDVVQWVRGWDTAASTDPKADFTRGVKIGKRASGRFVIAHACGGQLGPLDVDNLILGIAVADGRHVRIAEEREGGASGKAVIQSRALMLAGWIYKGVPLTGDKETRVNGMRSQAEAGNIDIVAGPWTEEYLDELCNFPNASHDDYVDASSCAFNELTIGPAEVQFTKVGMG